MYNIAAGVMNLLYDTDDIRAAASDLIAADPLARNLPGKKQLTIVADVVGMTARITGPGGEEVAVTPLTAKAIASCARSRESVRRGSPYETKTIFADAPEAPASATLRAADAANRRAKALAHARQAAKHLRRYGWRDLARRVEAQAKAG